MYHQNPMYSGQCLAQAMLGTVEHSLMTILKSLMLAGSIPTGKAGITMTHGFPVGGVHLMDMYMLGVQIPLMLECTRLDVFISRGPIMSFPRTILMVRLLIRVHWGTI